MILRRNRLAFVLVAGLTLAGSSVLAQTPTGEGSAESTFRRGMDALQGGRNAEAVVEFRQSYRLNPLPDVLFNLALALRGAGRHAAAIGAFERYLSTAPANVPQTRLDAVRGLLPQLRALVGRVQLELSPLDASLRVDGHLIGRAVDGSEIGELVAVDPHDARALLLDPGAHVVEASAAGFHTERHDITVRGGSQLNERLELAREVVPPVALAVAVPVAGVVTPHPVSPQTGGVHEDSPGVLTRWWFWTIAGVVVGGTVGAVIWITRDPETWVPGTRFDVEAVRAR